jgi:hypothetical protein
MLVSNCCGYPVKVYGATTKHYRCMKCWEPCGVEEEENNSKHLDEPYKCQSYYDGELKNCTCGECDKIIE